MSGCLLSAPMWRKLRLKASGKQWIAESIPLRRRLLSAQSSKNTPRLRRTKVLKSLSKQRNRNQKKWRCDYVFYRGRDKSDVLLRHFQPQEADCRDEVAAHQ